MQEGLGGAEKIALLLGLVPVFALALAAHEAGHIIAGRAVGFRMLLFVVGPLRIDRLTDRLRVALNRNLDYYGGVTIVVPQDTHAAREKLRWVMAGGPLASLITGALAVLVWFALDLGSVTRADPLPSYYTAVACQLYAVLSLGLGVVTLLPNRLMGQPSDGARLVELSRSGPARERDVAVMMLGLLSAGGQRPREFDRELVARAASISDDSLNGLLGHLLAYYHEMDHGRPEAAAPHLQHALQRADQVPLVYRGTIWLEGAFYDAVHRQDAAAARSWLNRAKNAPADAYLRHRGEAAVLVAEGNSQAALHSIDRAEQALSSSLDAGLVLAHGDELRALRETAQRAVAVAR